MIPAKLDIIFFHFLLVEELCAFFSKKAGSDSPPCLFYPVVSDTRFSSLSFRNSFINSSFAVFNSVVIVL